MKKFCLILVMALFCIASVAATELPEPQEPYPYLEDRDTLSAEWLMSYFNVLYEWARRTEAGLGTYTTDISNLTNQISSNTTRLDDLAARVASNTINIASLALDLAELIARVDTLEIQVASNTALIETNSLAIASNSIDIASNTIAIASNSNSIANLWAELALYRPIGEIKNVGPGHTIQDNDAWCYLRVNGGTVTVPPTNMPIKASVELRDTSGNGITFSGSGASVAIAASLTYETYGNGTVSLIKTGASSWELVGELKEAEEGGGEPIQ
jgi:hypothetical protein